MNFLSKILGLKKKKPIEYEATEVCTLYNKEGFWIGLCCELFGNPAPRQVKVLFKGKFFTVPYYRLLFAGYKIKRLFLQVDESEVRHVVGGFIVPQNSIFKKKAE